MYKIAAAQMCSSANVDENFKTIDGFLSQAKDNQADCLVIPEECLTLQMTDAQRVALSKKADIHIKRLSQLAGIHQIWLVAGSIPVAADDNHYYSTCLVFDDEGEIRAQYQKIHLFDVKVSDEVGFKESDTVIAGRSPQVVEMPFGKAGLSICYDLRFPMLYHHYADQGACVLMVPSAFTPQTGKVHWDVLLKARAIENLCYVVAPNQNGQRANGEQTYGHSCIISPWGETLAQQETGKGILYAQIDLDYVQKLKRNFPVIEHRKALRGAL